MGLSIRCKRLVIMTSLLCILLNIGFYSTALADDIPASSEFGKNLVDLGTWGTKNAVTTYNAGTYGANMPNTASSPSEGYALVYYEITDSDLITAIDNHSISINSSSDVVVGPFTGTGSIDVTHIVKCGATFGEAFNAVPLISDDRSTTSNAGLSASLTGSSVIPAGTRFIITEVRYDQVDAVLTANSIVFSDITTIIPDAADPVLTESYDTDWTNGDVEVTLTASDDSGIKGIYNSSGQVASNSSYTFNVSTNGEYTYYALDNANRQCDDLVIDITNIDTDVPAIGSAPNISESDWTNAPITITMDARNPAAGQSPENYMYSLNGSPYADFPSGNNVLTVTEQGETHMRL